MTHYITLHGEERPVTFSHAVAYEYELKTGRSYEADVAELAAQVILAGQHLGTDDVATAVRTISIVKYVDIMFAAMCVGYRKTKRAIDFTVYDLAEWLGEERQVAGTLTTMFLEANFNLKADPDNTTDPGPAVAPDDAKKKTSLTGMSA